MPLLSSAAATTGQSPKHADQAKFHIVSALYALPSTPIWNAAVRNQRLRKAVKASGCVLSESIVEMWEQKVALEDDDDEDLSKSDGFM